LTFSPHFRPFWRYFGFKMRKNAIFITVFVLTDFDGRDMRTHEADTFYYKNDEKVTKIVLGGIR
jgi:hypothetical protein